jgi:hypothetical protein
LEVFPMPRDLGTGTWWTRRLADVASAVITQQQ